MANKPRTGPLRPKAPADQNARAPLDVIGRTGVVELGGYLYDEWDRGLQNVRGRRVYREMADQDATVGAILYALEMLIRQVHWDMNPADDSPDAIANAAFVDGALDDMEETWPDTLAEILTMLVYGWSYHEICYKIRGGAETDDPTQQSAYSDRKFGWRSWAIRSQESLFRWEFDDQGQMQGLYQQPAPDYLIRYIPYEVALLFRPTVRRGNPEGRSLLRNAYRSYYAKKAVETIESIGIERDLAGFPVIHVPPNIANPQNDDDRAASDAYLQMLANIKRDEQEGVMLPLEYSDNGQPRYRFELMTSGGARQFDTNTIIQRYATQIAQSVLADFLQLGHGVRGSQALSVSKMGMFNTALAAILDAICAVVNNRAIPKLLRLNGIRDKFPTLAHGEIERTDIMQLGQFIYNLSQAGAELDLSAASPLLAYLLEEASLPAADGDGAGVGGTPDTQKPRIKQPVRKKPTPQQRADTAAPQAPGASSGSTKVVASRSQQNGH